MPAQKSTDYLLSCMRPQGPVGGLIYPLFEVGRVHKAPWPHGSAGWAASRAGEEETGCARKKGGANCFPSATRRTPDTVSQSSQGGLATLLLYIG